MSGTSTPVRVLPRRSSHSETFAELENWQTRNSLTFVALAVLVLSAWRCASPGSRAAGTKGWRR
jgi:hypothetical protein